MTLVSEVDFKNVKVIAMASNVAYQDYKLVGQSFYLPSPIWGWMSAWKRDGIQLRDEDQKQGSILYLMNEWGTNNQYSVSTNVTHLLCSKHL